ncbi:maackiain detoxification [Fusarium solani]|uniref:Maackiain detoxification n=1 Tax=Fusarium solani TaxID=169388 RepID=A0A9P9G735_FUSSL|nr:maackiain detoxification [Fusarium solani]KAH7232479.1 maackiain detoxification [Fusarium solani]
MGDSIPQDDPRTMPRYPTSGVSVLVVGGGIAGLAFAIEAYRKGHEVKIIERRPDINDYGDLIAIQESATHSPSHWPGFIERCKQSPFPTLGHIHKYDGTHLGTLEFPLAMTRASFHGMLYEYVEKLGIDIKFSTLAANYFETDDIAGVILEDGTVLSADIVVAADGIGSKSWTLVSGYKEKAISSGFAVFRATYPVELALRSPVVAKYFEGVDARSSLYMGPGAHIIVAKSPEHMIFMLTHKDTGGAEEEWTKQISVDHALPHVKGWTSVISEIIQAAPDRKAVDFKLMWRNPREKWASPKGRVIQIGDSAHTFLPTSASGATMALEDAYSLAACLQISGKSNAPLAVKVHNHLRAERVACAQKMGFKTRELYHNTDWEVMDKDPSRLTKMVGNWVQKHDPEQYAYENYGKCANHLVAGTPFKNTNAVPGYTYQPWTVKELLDAADRGETIEDDGEWV